MNCKPGDLAMVIKTAAGKQNGIVVRCIGLFTGTFRDGTPAELAPHKWWRIDREVELQSRAGRTYRSSMAPDRCLMPIEPIADESTTETVLKVE